MSEKINVDLFKQVFAGAGAEFSGEANYPHYEGVEVDDPTRDIAIPVNTRVYTWQFGARRVEIIAADTLAKECAWECRVFDGKSLVSETELTSTMQAIANVWHQVAVCCNKDKGRECT